MIAPSFLLEWNLLSFKRYICCQIKNRQPFPNRNRVSDQDVNGAIDLPVRVVGDLEPRWSE
eukprot:3912860-Amphidinium_carterae.1